MPSTLVAAQLDNGSSSREPDLLRVLAGIFTILLSATPILLLGRWTSTVIAMPLRVAASALEGIAFMVLTGALFEWLVHRYIMHRPSRIPLLRLVYHVHHRADHWVHFPPNCYVQPGPIEYPSLSPAKPYALCRTTAARIVTIAAYATFYSLFAVPIVAAAWLVTSNTWFTAVLFAAAGTLVFLFIRVHDAVHFPGASRLERFRWFWFLDHHHYIHHLDNRANTNFLLPLGDLVMGTLRLELTELEKLRWPAYEEARRLPPQEPLNCGHEEAVGGVSREEGGGGEDNETGYGVNSSGEKGHATCTGSTCADGVEKGPRVGGLGFWL